MRCRDAPQPGAYTAVVKGAVTVSESHLVEVYELDFDSAVLSKLSAFDTRGTFCLRITLTLNGSLAMRFRSISGMSIFLKCLSMARKFRCLSQGELRIRHG